MPIEFRFQGEPAGSRRITRIDISPKTARSRGRVSPSLSEALITEIEIDPRKAQASNGQL
jgi:hypothetical protein